MMRRSLLIAVTAVALLGLSGCGSSSSVSRSDATKRARLVAARFARKIGDGAKIRGVRCTGFGRDRWYCTWMLSDGGTGATCEPPTRLKTHPEITTRPSSLPPAAIVCGGPPSPAPAGTPIHAALSWFAAINAKHAQKARSYFWAPDRYLMNWGPASEWSTFSNVRCATTSATRTHAQLRCTFNESASPSEGNPDTFWDIYLRRVHQNWLIATYGQG
jgi:hypothetical protein